MDGIELAARFSYITNSLRFCGPEEASQRFLEYITNKEYPGKIESLLKKFEGLYPYLSAIAEKSNKNFPDRDVVEAYWIGNQLLDNFNDEDIKKIIKKLMQRGLPKSIGNGLIKNMPSGFVPHHNFNVFYVGVGRTTGSVPTTLKNMDNCMIKHGKVLKILKNKLVVQTSLLEKEGNELFLKNRITKNVSYLREILLGVKKDCYVALHWRFAPVTLTDKQVRNLEEYTKKILDVMNGR